MIVTKILIAIYIFLYISHIILGPYYYTFLIKNQPIKYKSKNIVDVLKYMIYITYISFLFTIYFLYNPNPETFICAFIVTLYALISKINNYKNSEYFIESIILHSILLIPFIFYKFYYNIQLNRFKPRFLTYFTIIFLIIYSFIYKYIY